MEVKIASKKELIKKSKYLIVENQGKVAGIDQEKIEQDKRHDGLKGYWTNLQAVTKPKEIIDQYIISGELKKLLGCLKVICRKDQFSIASLRELTVIF